MCIYYVCPKNTFAEKNNTQSTFIISFVLFRISFNNVKKRRKNKGKKI